MMRCRRMTRAIALHVAGDLPPRKADKVRRHLAECAGCRAFAEGLRENRSTLQNVAFKALSEAEARAMRVRVRQALFRPTCRRGWKAGLAAAGLAALAFGTYLGWQGGRIPAHPARGQATHNTAMPVTEANRVNPKAPAAPLVIKLVTDNPDVVILWLTEERTQKENNHDSKA